MVACSTAVQRKVVSLVGHGIGRNLVGYDEAIELISPTLEIRMTERCLPGMLALFVSVAYSIAFIDHLCVPAYAQPSNTDSANDTTSLALLTLDRIYQSSEFNERSFNGRWLSQTGGEAPSYTRVESSSIVKYDVNPKRRTVMASADDLTPPGATKPLSIDDYVFSNDLARVLIYTNSVRVWRAKTRGDYWVLDRGTRQLTKIAADLDPSMLMYAKFSPDGNSVAFVYKGSLYVQNLLTQVMLQIAKGRDKLLAGMSDWVYEEEFKLRDAFWWSPDGKSVAYLTFDTSPVKDFSLINNTDSLYPAVKQFPYAKAGTPNSIVKLHVAQLDPFYIWKVEPKEDTIPTDYLPRVQWIEGTGQLISRRMNRLQNHEIIAIEDYKQGTRTVVLENFDDAWIDLQDELVFSDDGKTFLYLAESDQWRHLYRVDVSTKTRTLLTPGSYDVIELVAVDQSSGDCLYFIASPDAAQNRFLYRYSFSDKQTQRITPDNLDGTHAYEISPDGKFAFHRHSSTEQPTVTNLITLPDHAVVETLESNEKLAEVVKQLETKPFEFVQIDIGETKLDAWVLPPVPASSDQSHPLLVHVYGEPAGSTVVNRWGGKTALWHRLLAQQGYMVASIDNRGTKAPRGREFRKSVYRQVGTLGPNDQAAAVKKLIEQRPTIDPSNVGIWGWSGGGTSTLHALFRHSDTFRTGISVAPVANLAYYDTIYEERYMGLPTDNVEGYRAGSAINFVKDFQGNLLLVHGTADDNVHFQASELLINELVKHNKQFDLFVYPGRSHSISEGKNTRHHLMTMVTDYLKEHLPVDAAADDHR